MTSLLGDNLNLLPLRVQEYSNRRGLRPRRLRALFLRTVGDQVPRR